MLNEPERDEGPEDGEYHFSDEESGYDTHSEEEAKAPEVSEHSNLAAKFSSYRRFVIIGGIFAGVLLVTYLIIPPLTTTPSTEITAVSAPPSMPSEAPVEAAAAPKPAPIISPAPKSVMETKIVKETPKVIQVESPAPHKSSFANLLEAEKEKLMAEKNSVMTRISSQESKPVPPPSVPSNVITVQPIEAAPAAPPALGSEDFVTAPVSSLMSSAQMENQASAENKATIDRLTAMQEATTKAIGQMQAQYSQKLADYEVRDKEFQDQILTLNTQISSLKAEMSKLVQALNRQHQAPPPPPSAGEAAANSFSDNNGPNLQNPPILNNAQPGFKTGYSVQAIIPGRAWLRTEGGETITVAEGDVLKSLGKVTKIDPYDGTIQVDTGNRVITLTYGNGEFS